MANAGSRCWRSARWPGRLLRKQRRGGDRLAGRAHQCHPLGAIGDERPVGREDPLVIVGGTSELPERVNSHAAAIERLARVEGISVVCAPNGSAQIVVGGATFALPLAGIIDFGAEEARLEKEVARLQGEIGRIDKKLANESFMSRAPEEVVEAEREKRAGYAADSERLSAALKRVKEAA